MKKQQRRLLSNPFSEEIDISELFKNLNIQNELSSNLSIESDMENQITELQIQMATLLAINTTLQENLARLEATQTTFQRGNAVTVVEHTDIEPLYTTGDNIQLDAFKVIHEFNGDKRVYRSWRTQVIRLMQQISEFKTHPKYAAALSIVRAKITGAASDILINNNTAHNIDAMIDRLDFSYADQRPLYVIEAEMTNIKQGSKTLQEFYDHVNQALNMVLTKITMTYKETAEQKSLITESQGKAIRTFMTGLNSALIRSTLYGSMPKSLSQAFAIAQTIQYDNQHLQLEFKTSEPPRSVKKIEAKPNFNPNFRYQQPSKPNFANDPSKQRATPMDVDTSAQNVQRTPNAFQSNAFEQNKRPREQSFQNANRQPSYQHVNKHQRVNHLEESVEIQSVCGNSLDNNYDTEIPDNTSTASEQGSDFLEE